MSFVKWIWRVMLLIVVGCFVTTVYYMTHNVNMDMALPALNIVGVAGIALLGVIWTAARKYWYALIMLVALGLLRGLFDDQLLTDFQSVWVIVSAGLVILVLLVVLMTRVLGADHAKHAAAAAAVHAAAAHAVAAQAALNATLAVAAPESAPAPARLAPPAVPPASSAEPASPPAAAEVKPGKKAAARAAETAAIAGASTLDPPARD